MLQKYLLCFLAILIGVLLGSEAQGQLTVNPNSSVCGCTGSINFQTTLTGSVTYTVTNSSGTVINTQTNATGSYTLANLCTQVYVLQATNGTRTQIRAFNVAAPGLNPGVASTDTICSNEGQIELENLVFNLQPGGSWFGPNNLPHSPQFNSSIDGTGLYYYQYTSGGCTVSTGVYITRLQNANSGTSTNYLFCEDDPPFNLIDYLEGSPDPGGVFLNFNGQQVPPVYDPATMPSMNLVYVLNTVQGCPPIYTDYILSNTSLPNPGTDNTVLACSPGNSFNMTTQLLGTPQTNGQWYNPSGVPVSNQFNPANMVGGTYRYQVPGANTCPSRNSFLTINTIPDNPSGLSNNVLLCPTSAPIDMFQELGGNPLTGGTWRNPSNQITDAIFNPANELGGNYTYYYPNVNCTPTVSTISVTIQANPSAGNDANVEICQSLSLFDLNSTVSANATPGGTWRNSLGATVSNAVSIPAIGNYQFSYNVGGGDCASDQAIINISVVGFNPNIPATSVSLCSTDASFDLSSLYAAYPTVVFQSASGASISNLLNPATAVSGVLTAVYPSTNVCPNRTANVTVTINTPAFSSRTVSYALCETTSSLDLSTLATGINFSNGTWTTSTGVATNASQTGLVPGNYGFLFTSFPNGTCGSSVLTVNVTMDASVSAGGDGSVAYCSTAPFQSFANLMPATVNQGGSWYYLNTPYNELGIDPASSPSGIYRYIIPPNGTCPGDDCSLTVDIDAFVEANAGNDISQCANNATVAIGTVGSPGATYSWSPAAPLSNANVPQPTLTLSNNGSVPLTTTFTLNVTNGLCSDTDQVEVSINPLAQASVTPMVETCAGESVTSTASGGSTYSWQPAGLFANPLSNEVSYIPTASATLIVTVSNAWNCSDTDTTLVVVHPTPSAVLNIEDVQGCSPVSTTIHVEPGGDYSELKWFLSGEWMADGDTLSVTLEESGEYDIAIALVSDFGCVDTIFSDATIQVYPNPKANFSITPSHLSVLNDVAVMQNQSEEATEYRWDFAGIGSSDLANPSFTFPSEIARTFEVCLYVNTDFGCADSVCNMIEMLHEVAFYAPNAITADNDGVNDVFLPVMLGFETDTYNMKIFNRWGDLIFETTDPTEPWVADVRSGEYYAHGDVYQWIVTVKENGIAEYQTFKGFVTVLR